MNSEEIQYALDRRGFVRITSGSVITTPIQLAHLTDRAVIDCPGDITYQGPPGRWAFEWRWDSSFSHTACHLVFRNIEFDRGSVANGGFLKFVNGSTMPKSLSMKQCRIESEEGYAIDANGVGYVDSLFFQDMRNFSSSAIRWIGASPRATGWVKIFNWRGLVTSRVGSSFLFKNCENVIRWRIIDDGSPDLITPLQGEYVGPINLYDVNCSGYNEIDDFWSEPWGSWATVAPGCWSYEFRCDETSGSYGLKYAIAKNLSVNAGGIDSGVEPFKIMGGDTSANAASLRVDLVDQFALTDDKVEFGGKSYAVAIRPMRNSPYDAADVAHFNDLNATSFRDAWQIGSAVIPYNVFDDRITYAGSVNQSNFTSEPAQYDA